MKEQLKNLKVKWDVWSLHYREYLVGFIIGVVVVSVCSICCFNFLFFVVLLLIIVPLLFFIYRQQPGAGCPPR